MIDLKGKGHLNRMVAEPIIGISPKTKKEVL